jgi:hypothetical protein
MKRLDLTGQVFGRLTALYPLEERKAGRTYWRCRCICGKEVDVQTPLLLHGGTQSCGCLRDKHKKDITGTRFGLLTAVYPTEKRQQNRVVWHCRCDCGGGTGCHDIHIPQRKGDILWMPEQEQIGRFDRAKVW